MQPSTCIIFRLLHIQVQDTLLGFYSDKIRKYIVGTVFKEPLDQCGSKWIHK